MKGGCQFRESYNNIIYFKNGKGNEFKTNENIFVPTTDVIHTILFPYENVNRPALTLKARYI
jgi:hypothetical protein